MTHTQKRLESHYIGGLDSPIEISGHRVINCNDQLQLRASLCSTKIWIFHILHWRAKMAVAKAYSCKFCEVTLCHPLRFIAIHVVILFCIAFFSFLFFFPLLPSVLDNLGPSITCDPPIVVSLSRSSLKVRQWMIDRLQWLYLHSGTHCQLSYAQSRTLNVNSRHISMGLLFINRNVNLTIAFLCNTVTIIFYLT